ncbi:MAG: hypothetical protein J2P46_07565, partial [Zavarzinella sp.]|nr:hypothetical protein [Zavarzinella sp.]
MQQSWLRPRLPVLPSRRAAKPRARSLRIEGLESRVVPANLDLSSGTLAYAAGAGVNNNLSVTISGSNFVFTDTAETITTSIPGATGSGTNTVSVPTDGVTAITLDLADGSDTIAAAGVVVASANPNLTITAQNDLTLAGDVNAGTGTIAILANQDGAGGEGLSQSAGTITTTNTTNSALTITVNTPAGGTGNASIDSTAVGASTTGGRLTVNSNGGSILYGTSPLNLSDSLRGLVSGGSAPARTLVARSYVFTATGAGGIGTDARPIQSAVPNSGTSVNLSAGSGGIYWTDWNAPVSLAGATATGAGNIRVVTANTTGHNLTVAGKVTTETGNIYLAADDNISVSSGVTIGGAGFSGTVWMQANRDQSTAGQSFTMNANSSIVTSNTTNVATPNRTPTTQAVYLDISGDQGNPSKLTVGNITTGDGGRIVLNSIPNGIAAEAGLIAMAGTANSLNAGATGTVELIAGITATTVADDVGTSATPVKVGGGNVVANVNFGNINITGTATTGFTLGETAAVANQTAAPTANLVTTAGTLTVAGPVSAVNGGAINLTSTGTGGGVAINAPLGSPTTGLITINAAGNPATLNSTLNLFPSSTLAVTAANGLEVSATGTLAGTGAATNATPLAVQPGGVVSPADANAVGTLSVGNLSVQAGGTVRLDLNSPSSFDSVNVTGTADVTGAKLALFANGAVSVGDSFTVLTNDSSDPIVGQFAGGTTVIAANDPRITFTLNYAGGDGNDIVATVSDIVATSLVDVGAGGGVQFASANGVDNNLTVTTTGGVYSVTD